MEWATDLKELCKLIRGLIAMTLVALDPVPAERSR